MPGPISLESRSFQEEKGLSGMRNRRGPEALSFADLRCDIDRAFVRLEDELDLVSSGFGLNFGPLVADPAEGEAGAVYWNTVINRFMTYDPLRSRWLSMEVESMPWGRSGDTAAGSYFKSVGDITFTATRGYYAQQNGVVVGATYTRGNVDAVTFEITADGVAIGEWASSAAAGAVDTLDLEVTAGQILGIRNKSGGNLVNNATGNLLVKWRV